jgi:hypothetical protein
MSVTTDHRVGKTKNIKKMKTLGKLKLKEEKMLTSEELLGIRGGSSYGCGCTELTAYQVTWCVDKCHREGERTQFCYCCCYATFCGTYCA